MIHCHKNCIDTSMIYCSSTCKESVQQPGTTELVCERTPCLVEADLVSEVNANQRLGWQASNYSFFWGRTLKDGVQYRLGTLEPRKTVRLTCKLPNSHKFFIAPYVSSVYTYKSMPIESNVDTIKLILCVLNCN
jgi:hypothetical protein